VGEVLFNGVWEDPRVKSQCVFVDMHVNMCLHQHIQMYITVYKARSPCVALSFTVDILFIIITSYKTSS